MATETYTVKVTALGNLVNRAIVEKAALEGRVIPPVVEYVPQGENVDLDPSSPNTKRLLKAGSVEKPGESAKREREALQARVDELKAEQDRLGAQAKSLSPSESSGPTKDELEAEVARRRELGREIEVTATGAQGSVKKSDLEDALKADDAAQSSG